MKKEPNTNNEANSKNPNSDITPRKSGSFIKKFSNYITLAAVIIVLLLTLFNIRLYNNMQTLTIETHSIQFTTASYTPTPIPTILFTETPVPVLETEPEYVLIDNLSIADGFEIAHLHIGQWTIESVRPFCNSNRIYESGIGMYIPSDSIAGQWGRDEMTYILNGNYKKIQFDVFADVEGSYGISSEYGLYELRMYADGEKIFDSEQMFYDDMYDDVTIILPEGTLQLKIQLIQKKGSNGTLDVVIGDFFLYPYDDVNIDAEPTAIIIPTETTEETTQDVQPSYTPVITELPSIQSDTVWINVNHLVMWSEPELSPDALFAIPYGYSVSGDIIGEWMYLSYDGMYGYIYLGKTSTGRDCVVYSEDDLEPLD